jgi:hypothetical protein
VGRTRWQLQLLFFFGIFDIMFGVASIGSSSLAIIGDCPAIAPDQKPVGKAPRRCLSLTFRTFCSESNQVVRPRGPWRRLSVEILADLEWGRMKDSIAFARFP